MQRFVDLSSTIPIINGARYIKAHYLANNVIIDSANPLVVDSVSAIKNYFNGAAISNDQFNSYLASSVLLHSLDGWTYLANAIESLLKGNQSIAIHLAYYAELRASMSFLAYEGIGIFNHDHICIDSINTIIRNPIIISRGGRRKNTGTHQFVWDTLEKWVSSTVKPNSNDLLQVFSVLNKNFEQWANAFPFSTTITRKIIIKMA